MMKKSLFSWQNYSDHKRIFHLFAVTVFLTQFAFVKAQQSCLDAPNEQYPSWMNITPVCDGTTQQIQVVTTGEYSMVDVTAGTEYKFSSSVTTDYITIGNEEGTEV